MKKSIDNRVKEDYPEYHIYKRELKNPQKSFSDSENSSEIEEQKEALQVVDI